MLVVMNSPQDRLHVEGSAKMPDTKETQGTTTLNLAPNRQQTDLEEEDLERRAPKGLKVSL